MTDTIDMDGIVQRIDTQQEKGIRLGCKAKEEEKKRVGKK